MSNMSLKLPSMLLPFFLLVSCKIFHLHQLHSLNSDDQHHKPLHYFWKYTSMLIGYIILQDMVQSANNIMFSSFTIYGINCIQIQICIVWMLISFESKHTVHLPNIYENLNDPYSYNKS